MAINIYPTNDNPMVHSEITCELVSRSIVIPTQPNVPDFCFLDYEAEFVEKKFASPTNESYKNDKSYFLEEVVDPSGTIVFSLWKGSVKIANITDDTYGTYTAIGGFTGYETDHTLKSGFILDFEKVYSLLGGGYYELKTEIVNYGRTTNINCHKYRLLYFNEKAANGTVVLKTTQNGYIQNGMDYSGLNWGYEFRLDGTFNYVNPEFTESSILMNTYDLEQIQAKLINLYELQIFMIPSCISRFLIENNMLSNTYKIMNYNLFCDKKLLYNDVNVYQTEVQNVEYFRQNSNGSFKFGFKDKNEGIFKRNYK